MLEHQGSNDTCTLVCQILNRCRIWQKLKDYNAEKLHLKD